MTTMNFSAKVQALLANAEDYLRQGNTEAAASYRAKAEQIMRDYRIAEEEALATDPGSAAPIKHEIRLTSGDGELDAWYRRVFSDIARHAEVRHATKWEGGVSAIVVGYEGDVRYAEYLWTSALLMFATRIDPTWDPSLAEAENIWRLRNAGIERRVIADQAWGAGKGKIASNRSKVQRVYTRECELRGEPVRASGLGFQTDVYREAYARGFQQTLADRLREARDAADRQGGAVALHGRSDRVNEAFYEAFPTMRPQPVDPNAVQVEYTPCARCAANPSGTCRQHPYRYDTAANQRRLDRKYSSASAYAGHDRGADAAREVDIVRGTSGTAPSRVDVPNPREALEG